MRLSRENEELLSESTRFARGNDALVPESTRPARGNDVLVPESTRPARGNDVLVPESTRLARGERPTRPRVNAREGRADENLYKKTQVVTRCCEVDQKNRHDHGKSGLFASSLNEGRRHASNHGAVL